MKRILLLLFGVLLTLPGIARDFTYEYEGQTLTYTVISEEEKTCMTKAGDFPAAGNKVSGNLIIPSVVDYEGTKYKVITIGYDAFYGCSNLTSINIPDGVTSIGKSAFGLCSSLTSINIPDGVTSIGEEAFYSCSSLTSIKLPDGVTSIGKSAFGACRKLTSINIPDGVTSIEEDTFLGCSNLASINIPDGVTSIGKSAFWACSNLTSINIPDGVTSIEYGAFYNCSDLTSIRLPDGVISIGKSALEGCSSLTAVFYEASDPISADDNVFDRNIYEKATLYIYEKGKTLSPWKNFQNIVTNTAPQSISWDQDFSDISDGDKIKLIATSSSGLPVKYKISSSRYGVAEIINENTIVFSSYGEITLTATQDGNEFYAPAEPVSKVIHVAAFDPNFTFTYKGQTLKYSVISTKDKTCRTKGGSIETEDLIIPPIVNYRGVEYSVTEIAQSSFLSCSSLTSIVIPESVTTIGNGAFTSCSSLTSITIPKSVTYIGRYAFSNCSSLTSITIPESVTRILESTFSGCKSLSSISLPKSLTTIDRWGFGGCTSIRDITLPDSLTIIGMNAFDGCSALSTITIPKNVTKIGAYAFRDCDNLSEVTSLAIVPPDGYITYPAFTYQNLNLYVYRRARYAYQSAPGWKDCKNIYTISEPQSIEWDQDFSDITVGDEIELTATSSSGLPVEYISSDHNIAVIEDGIVSFLSHGSVTLTASQIGDDDYEAATPIEKTVEVKPQEVKSLTISNSEVTMKGGDTFQLSASWEPETAPNPELVWVSENTDVATVNNTGLITAHKSGFTRVLVMLNSDNEIMAACDVIVSKSEQSIEWNQELSDVTVGDEIELAAISTSGLPIEYTSSDPKVAEIDGNIVKFIGEGEVMITAFQSGNDNYEPAESVSKIISVTKLALNVSEANIKPGETLQLIIENHEIIDDYEWTSSDEKVATVSESGLVTAVEGGEAVITLSRKSDGATLATCVIKVDSQSSTSELSVKKGVEIKCIGNEIRIKGASASSTAWVYNMNGQTIYSGLDRIIPLESGIYIVSIDGSQLKVNIR